MSYRLNLRFGPKEQPYIGTICGYEQGCEDIVKICYLADAKSVHTKRWLEYFARKGHQVHLISTSLPEMSHLPKVSLHRPKAQLRVRATPLATLLLRIYRLANRIGAVRLLILIIQIKKLLNRIKPDILHAHYVTTYGYWGALTTFHPFILTAWGSDVLFPPGNSRLSKWKIKFVLKMSDLITCDAEHLTHRMIQLGADGKKIKLIYFGVDTGKFNPDKRDVNFKKAMGLGDGSLVVISLRSLSQIYDVESLIKAAPTVLREVPQTKFVIAGDGEQRKFLEDLARSLGVGDEVQFVGLIPSDELPRYLASADVYVSTSLSDAGLAASTAEAMACQLPVVITEGADNRKWVKEGEGGFIVPQRDPTALAERITYLLKNETARSSFGAVNRKVMQERNEYSEQMEKMEHLYEELMKRR